MSAKNDPTLGYGTRTAAQRPAGRSPVPWGLLIAATVLAVGTIALIWFAAVPFGTGVCPAVYPMPPHCSATNREGTALVLSLVVGAIYIVTLLVGVFARRMRTLVVVGVVLLAVAPIVSYVTVTSSPGFPLSP